MSYVIKNFDDEIEQIIGAYKLTLVVNRDGLDLGYKLKHNIGSVGVESYYEDDRIFRCAIRKYTTSTDSTTETETFMQTVTLKKIELNLASMYIPDDEDPGNFFWYDNFNQLELIFRRWNPTYAWQYTEFLLCPEPIIDTGSTLTVGIGSLGEINLGVKLLITQYDSDCFSSFETYMNTPGYTPPAMTTIMLFIPRFCIKWRKINLLHNIDYFKTKVRNIHPFVNSNTTTTNIIDTLHTTIVGKGYHAWVNGYEDNPMFDKVDIEDDAFNGFYYLYDICNHWANSNSIFDDLAITSKTIGNNAFKDCNLITKAVSNLFNNSKPGIKSIGDNAFENNRQAPGGPVQLTSVEIPYTLETIGANAFKDCINISTVTIGDASNNSLLTSIGTDAFSNIASGTDIMVYKNNSYGDFLSISGRDTAGSLVKIVQNITTGVRVHDLSTTGLDESGLIQITAWPNAGGDIVIPDNVQIIDINDTSGSVTAGTYNVFDGNTYITSVTFPPSIKKIGYGAFYSCTALTSITFYGYPDSSGSAQGYNGFFNGDIESNAFSGCNNLTEILLYHSKYTPYTGEEYHFRSFKAIKDYYTSVLTGVPTGIQWKYVPYFSLDIDGLIINDQYLDRPGGSIVIPESQRVAGVGDRAITAIGHPSDTATTAFSGNTNITDITILGNNITNIGINAFKDCTNLTQVQFGSNLKSVHTEAFRNCTNLTNITLDNVEIIKNDAFRDCTSLGSISLSSIKILGLIDGINDGNEGGSFKNCTSLTAINLGDNIELIGNYTFHNCSNLNEDIDLPGCLRYLGNGAFLNTQANVKKIGNWNDLSQLGIYTPYTNPKGLEWSILAFTNSETRTISLYTDQESLASNIIGYGYEYATGNTITIFNNVMTTLSISGTDYNTIKAYDSLDIELVTTLGDLTFPSNATAIDMNFLNNHNITSVTLGSNITYIAPNIFAYCLNLSTIDISQTQLTVLPRGAFRKTSISIITIPPTLTNMDSAGWGANTDDLALGDPEGLDFGTNGAFAHCYYLTEVIFSPTSALSSIGDHAFYACYGLESFVFPSSVTFVGNGTFRVCSKFKSDLPTNTSYTQINTATYYGTGYTKIQIPDHISSINPYAFYGVTQTTQVLFTGTPNVTTIHTHAFSQCHNLLEFDIPASVTTLGSCVFQNCVALTTIRNPTTSIQSIGPGVFVNCVELSSIDLANLLSNLTSLSIPRGLMSNCKKITQITIPDNIKYIENGIYDDDFIRPPPNPSYAWDNLPSGAFSDCEGLTEVIVSQTSPLTTIGDYTFSGCKSLKSFTLSNNVKTLGLSVFVNCTTLSLVSYSNPLESIGPALFGNCTHLTNIDLDTLLGTQITFIPKGFMSYCQNITKITIPNSIEYIESGKFPPWESGNTDHYEVMVSGGPYDHTSSGAFNYCGSLTEVLFSMTPKIHAIGNYAFFECGNLEHFILPNSITYIAPQTFRNCTKFKSPLPTNDSFNTIHSSSFYGTGYINLHIPGNITNILTHAFYHCASLNNITVGSWDKPSSLTNFGGNQFEYYTSIRELTIFSNSTENLATARITSNTHSSYTIKLANVIENGTIRLYETIDNDLISNSNHLTFPLSATAIDTTFIGNTNIQSVILGSNITYIGDSVFENCTNMNLTSIGLSMTHIGSNSFKNCPKVNFNRIGDWDNYSNLEYIGPSAFDSSGVTTLDIYYNDLTKANNNTNSIAIKNVLENGTIRLYQSVNSHLAENSGNLTFPLSAIAIGDNLFQNITDLTSVTFGDNIDSIGNSAFEGCTNLQSITIPSSVTNIGIRVFRGCTSLNSANIDDVAFTTIPYGIFNDCNALTSITIPQQIIKIQDAPAWSTVIVGNGLGAFENCGLTEVIFSGTPTISRIGENTFMGNSNLTTFSFPSSVTEIGPLAFHGCTSFNSPLPTNSGYTNISFQTFEQTGYTSVSIPSNITTIGKWAFYGCASLTEVTIGSFGSPSSLDDLGELSFKNTAYGTNATVSIFKDNLTNYNSITNLTGSDAANVYGNVLENGTITLYQGVNLHLAKNSGNLTFPPSVTAIDTTFTGNSNIQSVTLGSNINYISPEIFLNCTNLDSANIEDSTIVKIPEGAFAYTGLTSITIPPSVDSLEGQVTWDYQRGVFGHCTSLTQVLFKNTPTLSNIGRLSFYGCSNLENFEFPDSITSIGNNAFRDCSKFKSPLPTNSAYTKIDARTFRGTGYITLEIPSNITNIELEAFSHCLKLEEVSSGNWNGVYSSITTLSSDILLGSPFADLIIYKADISDYSGITLESNYLRRVYQGNTLKIFDYNDKILDLSTVDNINISTLGDTLFLDNHSIEVVTIPNHITTLGDQTFKNCINMKTLTLGSTNDPLENTISFSDTTFQDSGITDSDNKVNIFSSIPLQDYFQDINSNITYNYSFIKNIGRILDNDNLIDLSGNTTLEGFIKNDTLRHAYLNSLVEVYDNFKISKDSVFNSSTSRNDYLKKDNIIIQKQGSIIDVSEVTKDDSGWYCPLDNGNEIEVVSQGGYNIKIIKNNDKYTIEGSSGNSRLYYSNYIPGLTSYFNIFTGEGYFIDGDQITINGEDLYFGGVLSNGSAISGTGGDPYVKTMYGEFYKIDNISGSVRLIQGYLNNKPIIINMEMKKDTKQEENSMNDWVKNNNKFKEFTDNNDTNYYNQSFYTKIYIKYGNSEYCLDLVTGKILYENGSEIVRTGNHNLNNISIPMYLDESVSNNVEFNIQDLIYVRIFKYKNKQVRNSVDIVGGKNIDQAYGILKKPLDSTKSRIKDIFDDEFLEDLGSSEFKYIIEEVFQTAGTNSRITKNMKINCF